MNCNFLYKRAQGLYSSSLSRVSCIQGCCFLFVSFGLTFGSAIQEWEAKITDVGMARLMSDAYFTQDASIGTFSWAAPEVLLGEK